MKDTCEHGTPTSVDCPKCRDILDRRGLVGQYMALQTEVAEKDAEIARLRNIIKGCPVCSELERAINTNWCVSQPDKVPPK